MNKNILYTRGIAWSFQINAAVRKRSKCSLILTLLRNWQYFWYQNAFKVCINHKWWLYFSVKVSKSNIFTFLVHHLCLPLILKKSLIPHFNISFELSTIQLRGISTFCLLRYFWTWEYKHILASKNHARKIFKIHINFELCPCIFM